MQWQQIDRLILLKLEWCVGWWWCLFSSSWWSWHCQMCLLPILVLLKASSLQQMIPEAEFCSVLLSWNWVVVPLFGNVYWFGSKVFVLPLFLVLFFSVSTKYWNCWIQLWTCSWKAWQCWSEINFWSCSSRNTRWNFSAAHQLSVSPEFISKIKQNRKSVTMTQEKGKRAKNGVLGPSRVTNRPKKVKYGGKD